MTTLQSTDYCRDVMSKQAKKLERLILEESPLLSAMAARAESTEVDKLAKALVIIHEANGTTVRLINHFTSTEVSCTAERSNLFRANSIATKMFQFYSKMHGIKLAAICLNPCPNTCIVGRLRVNSALLLPSNTTVESCTTPLYLLLV